MEDREEQRYREEKEFRRSVVEALCQISRNVTVPAAAAPAAAAPATAAPAAAAAPRPPGPTPPLLGASRPLGHLTCYINSMALTIGRLYSVSNQLFRTFWFTRH